MNDFGKHKTYKVLDASALAELARRLGQCAVLPGGKGDRVQAIGEYSRQMANVWQVQVAAPSREAATELVRGAVERRLAASGQVIGPVTSVFWHLGEFGVGEEWRIIMTTTEGRYQELEAHLVGRHEWKNPEIVAVPLAAGLAPYLEWVERTTRE